MKKETWKRSLIKTLVWKIIGLIVLGIISLFITGEVKKSLFITGWYSGLQFVLYIINERVWNKITWGIENE